jgi:rRNA processing protein Krr1/Pno1
MADFSYDIKIPKDRIAVLIGKKGELKHYGKHIINTTDYRNGSISDFKKPISYG